LAEKLNLKEKPGKLERMEAGLASAAVGVLNGARIIRTHDVSQTKKFFSVLDTILDQSWRR